MSQETPTTMTAVQMYELAVKIAKEMSESSRCDYLQCDQQDMKRIVNFINKMWENPKDEWAFDFLTRCFNPDQLDVIERHCHHLMYNRSDK